MMIQIFRTPRGRFFIHTFGSRAWPVQNTEMAPGWRTESERGGNGISIEGSTARSFKNTENTGKCYGSIYNMGKQRDRERGGNAVPPGGKQSQNWIQESACILFLAGLWKVRVRVGGEAWGLGVCPHPFRRAYQSRTGGKNFAISPS